ncbi:UDP-glucuronosyltransferase 2C1 [Fusarium oxysporum f. sp. rapae]|uniref:UDP-glucuronosyltransferase 2C1 n=1 Tax=Fusarium oxysporum f. sp. rapae TaxID=485398 RepID=A0A8J5PDG5_FUSOX|nr:UDP-glucuronosyltransferase 2C1 [Fusarium oxysporum f. sp. rapae]
MADSHEFRRRILLLATTGGFTHAAPVLEIGAVLASRGHDVQFATCAGQEDWTANYPFIKTVYTVGPAASEDDLDLHYETMRLWRHEHGFGPMMKSKYFFDNFWTDTYNSLRSLCEHDSTRPDFIVADFFADSAARDMLKQFNIQLASVWPQMPYAMAPVSYHPGQPGFQADGALTSEHASLSSRFWNEFVVLAALPTIIPWLIWTKRMRVDAGVNYSHSLLSKPDYLVLVNSFWGLEAPKELPPLMAPVGPILSDEYRPLDEDLAQFLSSHDRTIYVCLGTHVNLPGEELEKYLLGFIQALDDDSINGVIWSIPQKPRANFDTFKSYNLSDGSSISITDLMNDSHPRFRLPIFAPQRAILAHPHTVLFLTHGGGSSANETLFHGTPVLAIGYFFDQLCNSARLKAAGVGISLDKSYLTPSSISSAIANIISDEDGSFAMNVRRMQVIAALNSKRKHLAADLIEEVMIDQELRFKKGVELRPMHLQTADMHSFHGRETYVVILVLTANSGTGPRFVANKNRLCVSYNRHVGALWVVGDIDTLPESMDARALRTKTTVDNDEGEVETIRVNTFWFFLQYFRTNNRIVNLSTSANGPAENQHASGEEWGNTLPDTSFITSTVQNQLAFGGDTTGIKSKGEKGTCSVGKEFTTASTQTSEDMEIVMGPAIKDKENVWPLRETLMDLLRGD